MAIDRDTIINALRFVIDPTTGLDLVSLNAVQSVEVAGRDVAVSIALGYPAAGIQQALVEAVKTELKALPAVDQAAVRVVWDVPAAQSTQKAPVLESVKNIIAVASGKGGVGKSTITCNLAAISAHQGLRTLVVDLDPQGNTTQYLLGKASDHVETTLADFFDQTLNFKLNPKGTADFVQSTPFPLLNVMPSHAELGELQGKLESRYKIFKLRDALDELEDDYDVVYIDTPPALNFFTRSALIAAQRCLIPFDCDEFSRRALYALLENVDEIKSDHNRHLEIEGIVVNQFQPRASLPQKVVQELIDEGLPVVQPYLSASVKIKESHEQAKPMIHLDPKHKLAQEFVALHDSLARKYGT